MRWYSYMTVRDFADPIEPDFDLGIEWQDEARTLRTVAGWEGQRTVRLLLTSWDGSSSFGGARHWYVSLWIADRPQILHVQAEKRYLCCGHSPDGPLNLTTIRVMRPVTQEEIDADQEAWYGYSAGEMTERFDSREAGVEAGRAAAARIFPSWRLDEPREVGA